MKWEAHIQLLSMASLSRSHTQLQLWIHEFSHYSQMTLYHFIELDFNEFQFSWPFKWQNQNWLISPNFYFRLQNTVLQIAMSDNAKHKSAKKHLVMF